jgi:hypothetical protein
MIFADTIQAGYAMQDSIAGCSCYEEQRVLSYLTF